MAAPEVQNAANADSSDLEKGSKPEGDFAENAGQTGPELSPEHKEFLIKHHGTYELDPIPSMDEADPYNWPRSKKITNLVLVAFHACMGTFIAAGIIPAYENLVEALGITLQQASYLTSLQIAILGGVPLLWRPLANRYGRRPVFLLSLICSVVGNIGCAKSKSYAAMGVCRAIVAFFIAPPSAIGSAVVVETFFKHERARFMGVWTLMVILGVPIGPFIFGFVVQHAGYEWMFWVMAIINGVQFLLYLFLGPETLYRPTEIKAPKSSFRQMYFTFKRIDHTPLSLWEFVEPFTLATSMRVMVPAASHAMMFLFASVLTTVELPQLFDAKFGLNAQQTGLQFLSLIVGSVIGEQIGGVLSDVWMKRGGARAGRATAPPEFRLWLSYIGYALGIVGVVVFLVQTQNAAVGQWNITPLVGIAILAGGNQIVTTVVITYAVDCYHGQAGSVGVLITFVRQTWGFIGPFWFPSMFESVGTAASSGIAVAMIVVASVIPTIILQWREGRKRKTITE